MKEEKNITKNEMRFFQNDMLTDLKKLELQINNKINNMNQTLSTKSNEFDTKFTKIFDNISDIISKLTARKYDNERIEELISIKNKFSEQIIENQNRISILNKNLEDSIYKYDTIVLDNLKLPGIIGVNCKFKNCSMFFEAIHNELKLIHKNKEQEQNNQKTYHDKIDNRIFKLENELNKIHQTINLACQTKVEKYFAKIEEKACGLENVIHSLKIENSKHADNLIKASQSLQIQWDKLENIKKEIYDKFYEQLDIFKKIVDSTNRSFNRQENEFKILKQRFTQLAEYLKEFKNQKNKFKEILRNIDFTKKQKFDNEFDMTIYDKIGDDVKAYINSPSPKKQKDNLNFKTENKPRRRDSIESVSSKLSKISKKMTNRMGNALSPIGKRNSMIEEKKMTIELQSKKNVAPDNKMSNFNVKRNTMNDTNALKIKTLTEINEKDKRWKNLGQTNENMQKKDIGKKRFVKIIKKQKTIVTENNIDLNFESKKNEKINEKNEEESEEEEELLSIYSEKSSNFSRSSSIGITLHNVGEEEGKKQKDDMKKYETKKSNEKDKSSKKKGLKTLDTIKSMGKVENKSISNISSSYEKVTKDI